MDELNDIAIVYNFDSLSIETYGEYLAHAICLAGHCTFKFNGNDFELKEGDLMIARKGKMVEEIRTSDDFKVKVLYATTQFINLSTPLSNYGLKGTVALFMNPVMHLSEQQRYICERDFEWIEYRLTQTDNNFYQELLHNAVQGAIIDFFDFHSKHYGDLTISAQNAMIMFKFLTMLENGDYRKSREVSYYADAICVTPKYLSEISKKISGFGANYWINRYTILDIARLLRDKSLSLVQISDMFGFSSTAYFSRYVQNYLGVNPSEYRE